MSTKTTNEQIIKRLLEIRIEIDQMSQEFQGYPASAIERAGDDLGALLSSLGAYDLEDDEIIEL
jgi:hypothetical protein